MPIPVWILHECRKHLAARLQQRMSNDYLQKPLEPFSPVLNNVIGKAIREDFTRKRWDGDARRLSLEDIAERFEFAVSAADRRRLELEGGDVGAHDDFVRCVHATADAVCHGVPNLDLQEVLGRAVQLLEALRPRIW